MQRSIISVLGLMIALASRCAPLAHGESYPGIPLPDDVKISLPANTTPDSIKMFLGVWGLDAWGGKLPHRLIVEHVTSAGEA